MSDSTENIEVSILDRDELLRNVITKHERFIDEYTGEFTQINEKIQTLEDQIGSSKKKREEIINRTDLLKEKRQQLYHQAENLLDNMYDDIDNKLLDNKLMHAVKDGINKIKRPADIAEEEATINQINQKLDEMDKHDDIQKAVISIKNRFMEGFAASRELKEIQGTENNIEGPENSMNDLEQMEKRHGWLEHRIKSHKEALDYWKNEMAKSSVEQGVEQ